MKLRAMPSQRTIIVFDQSISVWLRLIFVIHSTEWGVEKTTRMRKGGGAVGGCAAAAARPVSGTNLRKVPEQRTTLPGSALLQCHLLAVCVQPVVRRPQLRLELLGLDCARLQRVRQQLLRPGQRLQ